MNNFYVKVPFNMGIGRIFANSRYLTFYSYLPFLNGHLAIKLCPEFHS